VLTEAVGRLLPRPELAPRFEFKGVIIALAVAAVAWLALVPLVFLLWQSILTPQTAAAPAQFTLENFRTAYGGADTARLFLNSVQFAAGAAVLALFVGTGLAWMNERTNTPFKSLFFALSIIPLVIPGILFTVSWIMLASPKIGLINLALQTLFNTDTVFLNIYSMAGMIWVDGLHYSPMAFLLRRLDAADGVADHPQARLAGRARIAADPVRALDRIIRGAGAARAARRHPRLYFVDLPGDSPVPEPARACLRLCRDAPASHFARDLRASAAHR
jgi:hypothetical protein